jgi:glycosyltransferase involved in cell wall biosynthesis
MKIALMTESFLPKIDGIVTMLTRTVECLQRNGHEVLIFAPSGGPRDIFGAEVVGMPSAPFPPYPELRLALPRACMRTKLKEFQPDILHLMEPALLGVGGLYYAEALDIPTVISYHTNLPSYLHYYKLGMIEKLTWKLMRMRHRRADLNLCTSTVMIDDLGRHGIRSLALWQRAVDANRFRPEARSEEMRNRLSDGHPASPLLLYVGRLSAEKDVARIRAVVQALPGTRLAIVGDGPLRSSLERHFKNTATYFSGYLQGEALASAYASADLFVLPSETETLGLVLLEAMASGCPVVACRAGGVPDAVQDQLTGFLFEPGDMAGFVDTVTRALSCRVNLDAVRARARRDVEKRNWEDATLQLQEYYADTIRNHPPKKARVPQRPMKRVGSQIALRMLRTFLP